MASEQARPRAPPFIDPPAYERHQPEETLLYQLVERHCAEGQRCATCSCSTRVVGTEPPVFRRNQLSRAKVVMHTRRRRGDSGGHPS